MLTMHTQISVFKKKNSIVFKQKTNRNYLNMWNVLVERLSKNLIIIEWTLPEKSTSLTCSFQLISKDIKTDLGGIPHNIYYIEIIIISILILIHVYIKKFSNNFIFF